MRLHDYRARLAHQARAVARLCRNTPPRQRIAAMAVSAAAAHGDDPAAEGLRLCGATALLALLTTGAPR